MDKHKLAEKDADRTAGTLNRFLAMNVRAVDGDETQRKFELSFSSEEPYTRWFGPEILDHSGDAVDLSRLNEIGVVLFNHDRDVVVGKILRAWIEDSRGKAEVEFDTDDQAEVVRQKVASGTLKGVSVGYSVGVWEDVDAGNVSSDGRFTGPCSIAKRWMPYELSIVSIPADATVGVGREMMPCGGTRGIESNEISLSAYERQIKINKNFI